MSDWPRANPWHQYPVIVIPTGPECFGAFAGALVNDPSTTNTTLTSRLVYLTPFVLPYGVVVTKIGWVNSSTVNGTLDVGIYDNNLDLIVSSGSVTQGAGSTTSTYQAGDITDTGLPPGLYYAALIVSNGSTGVYQVWGLGGSLNLAGGRDILGCLSYAHSADTLPSSITPSAAVNSNYPFLNLVLGRQL